MSSAWSPKAASASTGVIVGTILIRAVDRVDLEVTGGDRLAVIGPSGAGKSTLARLMVGLLRPHRGEVVQQGLMRTDVQIVFQDSWGALEPRWDVKKSIEAPLKIHRRPRRGVADRLADLVHLPRDRLRRRPFELSGGERQRVALARVLALEPRLLVLDEPLMGLDSSVAETLRHRLVELQRNLHFASVWITHAPGEAVAVAERVVVMNEGRIVERGPARSVLQAPQHAATRSMMAARAHIVSTLQNPS
ncbi:MAG: ATP-binding cassette domain-containing protein [Myxococcota bacterium]